MNFGRFGTLIAIFTTTLWMMVESVWASEFYKPWRSSNSSIVLDAYEYTPLDWTKLGNNKRLVGFINKASDGLSPSARCGRNVLCRVKRRRYTAAKELYHTRKVLAKTLGMKWGAYHLARPGNPIKQAEHFLNFARPAKDELMALDIEHNDPSRWMSLSDAEIFARHIKSRTGRYPALYTNHSTSKFIAANRSKYKLLSKLNLWYARYKPDVRGVFPMGHWKSFTIWQFSSMVNCNDRTCPWRINGAGNWIDVNVVNMPPAELKKKWPFSRLTAVLDVPKPKKPQLLVRATRPASQTDTIVTGAINPSEAKTVKPSARNIMAGLTVPLFRPPVRPKMAVELASLPSFRPGSRFVAPVEYRTSDSVILTLAKVAKPLPTPAIIPVNLPQSGYDALPTGPLDQRASLSLFSDLIDLADSI